ncbi:MAG TPA: galactokinase family protein, partial [Candidatus Acidoferrales bacterium]|nr:galactokinase family protein [Candidatus Acidoferrales bacterium]
MNSSERWDDSELARAERLARELRRRTQSKAQIFAARAPGRVNLIGEHTDYSALPVLPVAIDRSTIVVARANTTAQIDLSNADADWPPRSFAVERRIPPYPAGDWGNYVKAALQGVLDRFADSEMMERIRGASMLVEGRVPPAAGLSSSAALTVSTAMAFMAVNNFELEPLATAAMVARSEWYVGTRAGGMDQAASILGRRDHALMIEFDPLRVRAVKMPASAALVVADSREVADKSGRVRAEYNRRVVECALAARFIGRALKLDDVKLLGHVVRARPDLPANEIIEALAAFAPATLGTDLREASRILSVPHTELESSLLGEGPNRIGLDSDRPL